MNKRYNKFIMTAHQSHGKRFEQKVLAVMGLPENAPTARFDADATEAHPYPVSIKARKGNKNTVEMGDARRMLTVDQPFKLIIGDYAKKNDELYYHHIHEMTFETEDWNAIIKEIPLATITEFHDQLTAFPEGHHQEARAFAKSTNQTIKQHEYNMSFHPKIDSKTQRRLQCSLNMDVLKTHASSYTCHTQEFQGQHLSYFDDKKR